MGNEGTSGIRDGQKGFGAKIMQIMLLNGHLFPRLRNSRLGKVEGHLLHFLLQSQILLTSPRLCLNTPKDREHTTGQPAHARSGLASEELVLPACVNDALPVAPPRSHI